MVKGSIVADKEFFARIRSAAKVLPHDRLIRIQVENSGLHSEVSNEQRRSHDDSDGRLRNHGSNASMK